MQDGEVVNCRRGHDEQMPDGMGAGDRSVSLEEHQAHEIDYATDLELRQTRKLMLRKKKQT